MNKPSTWILLLLLLSYWAISLSNLTVLPLVYEDEPWQISTGWKLASQGVFGSDMFAGYHGREHHYYGYMPLHPLALAVLFRAAGTGLVQARLETVAWGLLILALTFRLAQRLFRDARIALLAIAILLFVRGFALSPLHPTGILFLDVVRVARYDVLVPLLGLAAVHLYLEATARAGLFRYFLAGGLCALAGLSHLYGAFFLFVLLALLLWKRPAQWGHALAAILAGFMVPWLFYVGYVLQDVEAWRGQVRAYGERFTILDWRWYFENAAAELGRYSVGITENGKPTWRPGFWAALVGLVVSSVALGWRAFFSKDSSARVVFVPLVLFPILFALLIRLKFTNYLFVVAPFAALALAWLAIEIWDRTRWAKYRSLLRAGVVLLGVVIVLEGVIQIVAREVSAQTTTPYDSFIARVREQIPPHTRVYGLQNYGLGWEGHDYRSLAIPFQLTNPQLEAEPLTLDAALDAQSPDYVLLDWRMKKFLAEGDAQTRTDWARWMQEHGAVETARVRDPSYGDIEIYRVGD